MVIVEGPDGSGKSTLIKRLMAVFDPSLRIGQRNPDRSQLWRTGATDVYRAIAQDIAAPEQCQVWDRLFYSELIYPQFMGRPSCFDMRGEAYVSRILNVTGAVVIFCLPPRATVVANCEDDDTQHEWVRGNGGAIWDRYQDLYYTLNRQRPTVKLWDYTLMASTVQLSTVIGQHLDYRKGLVPNEPRRPAG